MYHLTHSTLRKVYFCLVVPHQRQERVDAFVTFMRAMAISNFSFVQLLQGTSWRLIGSPAIFRSRSTFQFWSENYLVASPLLILSLWCSYGIQGMVKCNLLHNQMCCPDDRDEAPIKSFVAGIALYLYLHCISSVFLFTALPLVQHIPTDLTSSTLPSPRQSMQCNGAHSGERSDKRYSSRQKLSTTFTSS